MAVEQALVLLARPWLCGQEVVLEELLSETARVREVEMLFVEELKEAAAVTEMLALLLERPRQLLAGHEYSLR